MQTYNFGNGPREKTYRLIDGDLYREGGLSNAPSEGRFLMDGVPHDLKRIDGQTFIAEAVSGKTAGEISAAPGGRTFTSLNRVEPEEDKPHVDPADAKLAVEILETALGDPGIAADSSMQLSSLRSSLKERADELAGDEKQKSTAVSSN